MPNSALTRLTALLLALAVTFAPTTIMAAGHATYTDGGSMLPPGDDGSGGDDDDDDGQSNGDPDGPSVERGGSGGNTRMTPDAYSALAVPSSVPSSWAVWNQWYASLLQLIRVHF